MIFNPQGLRGQGEANIWYFGAYAGLDFSSGSPVALNNSAMSAGEGCATVSDNAGNLLFYTNGQQVFNASHQVMPNGSGLLGHQSSAQSAVVVSKPNSPGIYYIFTVKDVYGGTDGCRYSEVDMSLQGGLGDVTTVKNVQLQSSTSEKITVVRHANWTDYWVLVQANSVDIHAYEVTSAGVNPNPVISNTGGMPFYSGTMKASPDGKWIARNGFDSNPWGLLPPRLMRFDNASGQVTASIALPMYGGNAYGLEFSKTSNYLYINYPDLFLGPPEIRQFDLSLGSLAAIANSDSLVGFTSSDHYKTMQLAPDGKIYMVGEFITSLYVINNPDAAGTACNVGLSSTVLTTGTYGIWGLPNFAPYVFDPKEIVLSDTCENDITAFYFPYFGDSVYWDFGDTASGPNNQAFGDTAYHTFSGPGSYQVICKAYFETMINSIIYIDSFLDTANVTIHPLPQIDLGNDTVLCKGDSLFQLGSNTSLPMSYLWSDSTIDSFFSPDTAGTFWVEVSTLCGTDHDTITILEIYPDSLDLGPDSLLCEGETVTFDLHPSYGSFLWQDGSTSAVYLATNTGQYSLTTTGVCGTFKDSVNLKFIAEPDPNLPPITTFCVGDSLVLNVSADSASYLWNDGSTDSMLIAKSTNIYAVTITNHCGQFTDSAKVIVDSPLDINLGPDVTICEGDTHLFKLQAINGPTYLWNDGTTDSTLLVSEEGIYKVSVTNSCGSFSDEVAVYLVNMPKKELPEDTILCEGQSWDVIVPEIYSIHYWQDGSTDSIYTINEEGIYWLTKRNECGKIIDTVDVSIQEHPVPYLGPDTVLCASVGTIELNAETSRGQTYHWNTHETSAQIEVEAAGEYSVTVTDLTSGCSGSDQIDIGECPIAIWIPNAFSPNRDDLNEVFLPQLSFVTDYSLTIYDRWGGVLFSTTNPEIGWNGHSKGKLQPMGIYPYVLSFYSEVIGKKVLYGQVMLLN